MLSFQWCNKDVRCKKLQLTDLLVSPVHHIMKIPLVIRDIESRTDDIEEKTIITRIHEMKEHSLSELFTYIFFTLFQMQLLKLSLGHCCLMLQNDEFPRVFVWYTYVFRNCLHISIIHYANYISMSVWFLPKQSWWHKKVRGYLPSINCA